MPLALIAGLSRDDGRLLALGALTTLAGAAVVHRGRRGSRDWSRRREVFLAYDPDRAPRDFPRQVERELEPRARSGTDYSVIGGDTADLRVYESWIENTDNELVTLGFEVEVGSSFVLSERKTLVGRQQITVSDPRASNEDIDELARAVLAEWLAGVWGVQSWEP